MMSRVPLTLACTAGAMLAGAGLTLGIQSLGSSTLARVQQGPDGWNHVGAAATGIGALVGASFIAARAGTAAIGVPVITGAIAGATAGAYLLAPSVRRFLAEH